MKKALFFLLLLCIGKALKAQYVYTIKADSVKITNSCDTAELIIENHTQTVPGFLFNRGRGRTEFRKVLQKISDSLYLVGPDSLKIPNAWLQGGNRFGSTGKFGTLDSNHIDFYTNSTFRGRLTSTGNMQIGSTSYDNGDKLQIASTGAVTIAASLSRPGDRIQIGRANNYGDGQNVLIRTSNDNGATYKDIFAERDGHIALGISNRPLGGWWVCNPALRINANGQVSIASNYFIFGNEGGPWNSSSLVTYVSNMNEWNSGLGNYPNRQNYYYFGTGLSGPEGSNVRAPLKISARELHFLSGGAETEAARISENRNFLIGTTTDINGYKLQVDGTTYSKYFTNATTPLGSGTSGALRLRWGGAEGTYVDFYYDGNTNRRGYIGSPSDSRSLIICDSVGLSFSNTPYVSIGSENSLNNNTKLSVITPQASAMDAFGVARIDAANNTQQSLVVKASGNTVIGNASDNGNKLQVNGTVFISDTLKLPNIISKTDTSYKPMVVDASGNVFKMAAWNTPQITRTAINDAGYSALTTDYLIAYTSLSAARTVTLPAASGMTNHILIVKDESGAAGTNNITINVTAGGTIDGASSKVISSNYGVIEMYSNGSQWFTK